MEAFYRLSNFFAARNLPPPTIILDPVSYDILGREFSHELHVDWQMPQEFTLMGMTIRPRAEFRITRERMAYGHR